MVLVRVEEFWIFRFGNWRLCCLVRNWIGRRFGFSFGRKDDEEEMESEYEYEIGMMFFEEIEIEMGMRMRMKMKMVVFQTLIDHKTTLEMVSTVKERKMVYIYSFHPDL
jgi:hypothetical protein